jgi:DNA-binding NarL/FixJ family response regulator
MPSANKYKVIIVDDDAVHLDKLGRDLEHAPNIKLIGSHADPKKAVAEILRLKPDVVLSDIEMPGMSGLQLIQTVRQALPDTEVIALTVHGRQEIVLKTIKAGANGYLLKGSGAEEIVNAISMIKEGGAPLSPEIARLLVRGSQTPPDESVELTGIEQGIVRNIEKGLSYKEIASLQNVTTHAIHWHIKNIYIKLRAGSRKEMLNAAKERGMI